ncbi:unnamed protein product [Miscanthus lutarioriparius]|uniref:Inositol hexakisphosphate and diphosphoinositol-pentakisphosphate kinase n=1 Tax=Miscanthus lutarioriparius TaxID=422564 RepID=A0A811P330_9POAL|nr:unnamed protein product [Miscanthus lutarioriparius]
MARRNDGWGDGDGDKIKIGVCVMEKTVSCSPMEQILERLRAFGEFEQLKLYGVPVPTYAVVRREYPNQELSYFVEEDDFIEIHGKRFCKPFVEKPIDGDDHNIMIYYPSSAGGGMKELFRKVGNRSSEFYPYVRKVRRDGSYIYEEFMPTRGTDVKVYTVGPVYAHAEAQKSPVVDGVVMRNSDGKEVRYPVLLTPSEKQIARSICQAFRQAVCGFDLLRYYDDDACILRKIFLDEKAPHIPSTIPTSLPWKISEPVQPSDAVRCRERGTVGISRPSEELRCVIAVIRHGDRTPKQKVKLKVTEEKLLKLMLKYNGGKARAEAKLKSALQLQDLLDATRILVPLEHPKRFRIEMTFSRGADISSLESGGKESMLPDDHTMPIMEPERLQEVGSYITLDKFDKMARPFAMPAEDFPPAAPSQPLPVRFCKDIELQAGKLNLQFSLGHSAISNKLSSTSVNNQSAA